MLSKLAQQIRTSWSNLNEIGFVVIAIFAVTGLLFGVRELGILESWELLAYDLLMQRRAETSADPRVLAIAITEQDLRSQKQWPISDGVLAQVLRKLQSLQPKVIGLDLYRDLPVQPGRQELIEQLKQPNVIAIRNIDTLSGTPAPPEFPPEQVGFNDLVFDPDGVVRRNLLFAEDAEDDFLYCFGLRLVIAYLKDWEIVPQASEKNPNHLQLGEAVFVPLAENTGGYETMDSAGYQILLNYRNRNNVAKQISLDEFLSGSIPADLVKDKIVLIGSTAPSLKDTFFTPYSRNARSGSKMSGVIIHAHIVSQLLDAALGERSLFRFWSESVQKWWIFGWVCLGGFMGWRLRHPLTLTLVVAAGLGMLFGAAAILFNGSVWILVVSPALGFLFSAGIVVTYQSYFDHQQQQIVMKLLGQNTSPEIARYFWKERDRLLTSGKLPGVSLIATIMFADIKGFSTISEQMRPSDLLDWLNELLEVMTTEVLSHQGTINKFTGDGVMAVFGMPRYSMKEEDIAADAQRCVNCALRIGDRLDEINARWHTRGLPVIQMRIGIFTGPVVVGSVGGKDRLEYGVIGDTVNTAARLESCEKQRQPSNCRILIARETLVHLQDKFQVESWGAIALKGKEQIVDVYWLVNGK